MDENPYKAPNEEKPRQRRGMWSALFVLGILLSLAPIFGTLLTTAGMVSAFQQIAASQEQPRPQDLATGISRSMIFTALGLSICPVGVALAIVSAIKLWWRKTRA